jgi:drug/metabolite transporter (DMT)-like permease
MNKTVGILLIVVGAIMVIWTGFTYTKKEKIIDAGPIHLSADRQKTVNWPPYLGAVLIIGGVAVMVLSKNK